MLLWHRSHLTGELPSIQVCCITCERWGGGCCSHKPSSLLSGSVAASWIWDLGGGCLSGVYVGTALPKTPPGTATTGLCCPAQHTGVTGPLQAPAPLWNQARDGAPEVGNVQELQTPGSKKINKYTTKQAGHRGAGDGRAREVLCAGHLLTLVFLLDLA